MFKYPKWPFKVESWSVLFNSIFEKKKREEKQKTKTPSATSAIAFLPFSWLFRPSSGRFERIHRVRPSRSSSQPHRDAAVPRLGGKRGETSEHEASRRVTPRQRKTPSAARRVQRDEVRPGATSSVLVTSSEALVTSSDALVTSSDALVTSSDALDTSSDALVTSSDALVTSSDALVTSSDALVTSSDALVTSSDALVTSSDALVTSSDALVTSSDALVTSSDALVISSVPGTSSNALSY